MQKIGWRQWLISKHRLFVVVIFIFSALAHLPHLAPGGPSSGYPNPLFLVIDEGTVLYDSFRITSGEVIYRDFFQFQGPVFYHVYAGLFFFTGPSIAAARGLNLLITSITATFIALLVTRILGRPAGATAAFIHAWLLVPMYPYAYPHWLAETFAFAGIYLIATNRGRVTRDVAAGASLGLSAATIQSLGVPILFSCMVILTFPGIRQRNWREICVRPLRLLGGASLSIVPFIIYLGLAGALEQMWYGMVEWVSNHYSQSQKDAVMQGYGAYLKTFILLHKSVGQPWRSLAIFGLQLVRLLPVFAIFGLIVTGAQSIKSRQLPRDDLSFLMSSAAFAGTAPLLLGITRPDIVHIAFIGSLGLCGVATAIEPLVNWKPFFRGPLAVCSIIIVIFVTANFAAKTVMTYRPSREMKDWRGEILKLGIARLIDDNLDPRDRVVSAYGGLHYLYIRRAAVGFTFLPFNAPNYYSDRQWRQLGRQILEVLPPMIEVTEEQWLQVTQRTPELDQYYRLVNNRFLVREGFSLRK